MKKQKFCTIAFAFLFFAANILAQISPAAAGYLDAVADFGADNSGKTLTTIQLQKAIDSATSQKRALFLPAGVYLIDKTLECNNAGKQREDPVVIAGSSVNAAKRSVIKLRAGSFTNPANPQPMVRNNAWEKRKFPDTFNRMFHSIDLEIEENNPGAVGLAWRGAEGCSLFDVHIDVTGGFAGINGILGSGGSTANFSVTGGQYGVYLASDAAQPTPVITDAEFKNQEKAAIFSNSTRGPLTITGAVFMMKIGVPVLNLTRHGGLTWSPGGNPVLTDCVIEYLSDNPANKVITMTKNRDQSVFFMDVYIKNAAVILNEDTTVNGSGSKWRHYKKLAYNSGWDLATNGDEPVYINGKKLSGKIFADFADDEVPPANLRLKHSWGKTFPGFETPGVINVNNYKSLVDNGDWAPAFNAAIDAAHKNNSHVVFVPAGEYVIFNTIHLKSQTALVGVSHYHSVVLGRDMKGRRFGGSTNPWTDPKPMLQTPDDQKATCVLADIAIRVNGPFNGEAHSNEAMACYAFLWRAGNNSVIRNISYMHKARAAYRSIWALVGDNKTSGLQTNLLYLRSLESPLTINHVQFSGESKMKYHTAAELPSRILLETVNGNKRIMPRSMPPSHFNAAVNPINKPNITISTAHGKPFAIKSLKIANAAWNPNHGDSVTITGFGSRNVKIHLNLKGTDRQNLQSVELNWKNIRKVEITSPVPFSLDDLTIDGQLISFDDQEGSPLQENVDWNHWFSGFPYMFLPVFYTSHGYAVIEGGCKFYNHWIHGGSWLHITEPYILVKGNNSGDVVNFYHFHAQHSQNFSKMIIENAHNVSVFGSKTENALEFVRVSKSDNLRFLGHGGMTNPPVGVAHYRIENSTNWMVVSPSNEIHAENDCKKCGLGDAMLPLTVFGTFDVIHDVENGKQSAPAKTDIPILYMKGNPAFP